MNKKDYKKLPDSPGVYIMKDGKGSVLYVGKAGNLRRRVSSYFERPHDVRIETLVSRIATIDFEKTDTALEALIREAELIRKFVPPFNVKEKDDKSFLYIEITKEKFPRVLLARGQNGSSPRRGEGRRGYSSSKRFGPFVSASSVREALKILRRIFPWSTHPPELVGKFKRPCFDHEIGLCPGTCIGAISPKEYQKNIARLKLFLDGKKARLIRALQKDMAAASRKQEFEKAVKLRKQIFALKHIQDTALISDSEVSQLSALRSLFRIEGYDISNISGMAAVGSMVVFENGEPNRDEYRKFKIKTIFQPNDVGMLTEVLTRRFARSYFLPSRAAPPLLRGGKASHSDAMLGRGFLGGPEGLSRWPLPDLILIDGGLAQVNAARRVLFAAGLKIPIVGLAKGPERKRNDLIGDVPRGVSKDVLIKVRNEAHRFAILYHKAVRGREFLK
jgi:excinuclease ABC subunit C